MRPAHRHIELTAGDVYVHAITFDTDQDGYTFTSTICGATPTIDIDGATVTISLTALQTAALADGFWRLRRSDGITILTGHVDVTA